MGCFFWCVAEFCLLAPMPLIIVCGLPCSGKTTQSNKIAQHIQTRLAGKTEETGPTAAASTASTKKVVIISEESLGVVRNEGYKGKILILSVQYSIINSNFRLYAGEDYTRSF